MISFFRGLIGVAVLAWPLKTFAEVLDKCPSPLSHPNSSGDWELVAVNELFAYVAIRLLIFLGLFGLVFVFCFKKNSSHWSRRLMKWLSLALVLNTFYSYLSFSDPCNRSFIIRELMPPYAMILIVWDAIINLVPFFSCWFGIRIIKSKVGKT